MEAKGTSNWTRLRWCKTTFSFSHLLRDRVSSFCIKMGLSMRKESMLRQR